MFTWLGTKLTGMLGVYVFGIVSKLSLALTPIALTSMTLWVFLYGWAVLRNEVPETVPVFLWKVTKISLVLIFALQAGFYIANVADAANDLATGVATTFLPAGVPTATVTSPYALLDQFNDNANKQVADIMMEAGITRLDLVLAACIFSIGTVAFLCVGVFVVTLATVLLNFVIAIGPIFILCLAWKPTARFFDSWLSMLLNVVVLTWFAFFALGLSAYVGDQMFTAIQLGGGFLGSTFNVLGESTRYCVLMLVMAIICFQAPSLAAALTGGAVVQQGVQMIQNAMVSSGLRSAPRNAPTGAGGTIRGGTSAPYAAGHAAGRTVAASARTVRTAANKVSTFRYRK